MKMKRLSIISLFTAACLLVGVTTVFATSFFQDRQGHSRCRNSCPASDCRPCGLRCVREPFHLTVKDDQKLYYFDLLVGKFEDSYQENMRTKAVGYLEEKGCRRPGCHP